MSREWKPRAERPAQLKPPQLAVFVPSGDLDVLFDQFEEKGHRPGGRPRTAGTRVTGLELVEKIGDDFLVGIQHLFGRHPELERKGDGAE